METPENVRKLEKVRRLVDLILVPVESELDEISECSDSTRVCISSALKIMKKHSGDKNTQKYPIETGCIELNEQIGKVTETDDRCVIYEIGFYIPGISYHWFNIYQCGEVAIIGNSWSGQYRYQLMEVTDIKLWVTILCNEINICNRIYNSFLQDQTDVASIESKITLLAESQRKIMDLFGHTPEMRFGHDIEGYAMARSEEQLIRQLEKSILKALGEEVDKLEFNSSKMRATKVPTDRQIKRNETSKMYITSYYISQDSEKKSQASGKKKNKGKNKKSKRRRNTYSRHKSKKN